MERKFRGEHPLEGRSQLFLVGDFVRTKGEVDTVRDSSTGPLGNVPVRDVPAEDEAEIVGLLHIAIHRHELDPMPLLVPVLRVGVHLADQAVDVFVAASPTYSIRSYTVGRVPPPAPW